MKTIPILLSSILLFCFTINTPLVASIIPYIGYSYIGYSGNQISGSSGAQINVYVGQAFTITVNGANNGATTAVGGGIDLELWDVTTQNGNQISLTSNASNQEYWVGSKLGTGQTSQYLLLESGFSNWSGGAYKALQVNFQILKPGTYRLFTKMYLTDGSGNFPRDPSSTGPYKDQQEQGCYLIGTIIAQNPPPSVSKVTISLSPTTVNLGQYSTGTGSLNGTGSSTVNYIWEYQKPGQSNWNQYDTSSTTMTNGIGSLFSIPFTPPFDTPGIYVFRARTTSPNQIISNTKSITVPEPPKPDLTVTSVILDKNSVQAGWPVNVTYTLKNSGPAASTGVSKTGFYLSTTQYGAQTYLNETPDASINLVNGTLTKTSGVIIPANTTSGDYYLTVFADYINMVDEGINEGNNILGTAISVFKFEVKGITLNATTPTTIDLGGYVTTSGTITGVGSGTVSVQYEYQKPNSSTWLTYDSPSNITMTNNSATLYNETFTPQFDTPGIYLVRARTTSPNQVTSAPLSITIRTPPKPNLTISTISFNTPSVQAGEAVNFTYTLKNLGPAASTGVSWTGFYLSTTPYGTQIFLGETPESSIATVNGTNTKTNGVIIPANTLPGTYYLSAYADYKNQIDEGTNEDDNIKSAQLNVIKFEVTGVNISVTPSSLNEDELMTKSATFSGTGSGTVYYRWEDKIPGSSTWNPIKDNSVLMTDGSATLSAFQIPAYAPLGTHYHRIVVTSPNALTSAEVGQDVNSSLISTSIYAPSDIGNGITPLDFHGKPGTLVRFGAILVKKDILSQIIELDSKQIKWEIQLPNSGWTPIDEDGISTTNQLTSFDGIIGIPSENYYVIPDDLTTGDYNIRAYFIGDNQYSGCSRTGILTVDPIVNEITLVNPNINSGNGIPVILVHGNGNDKSEQPNSRWDQLIAFINDPNNTELFKDFDIYNWQHVTEIPIGFNGTTGNAKHLANFINTFTSQGKKVILVAHSQGGLICRSYMNYGTQGENVLGLITLATPHHGSPLAVPDWAALVWRDLYNNSTESSVAFNLLYDRNQTIKKLCQVDYDRIGDLNLAWDNLDLALNTGLIYADFPGISFAVDGKIQPSARDMNQVSSFSDKTLLYSDKLKSQFGTLAKLNQEEIQKGQNLKKIIAYGAYDDDLSDNPKGVANTVGEIVKNGFEFEHNGLSFSTYVMSEAGKQSLHLDGLSVFYANDGMVPLQSALFLDISGGTVFSGVNGSNGVWYNSNIESKKQVKLQRIFSGTADGIKDHLDLLDTKSETYWKILANDIRSFLPVSDQVPPTLTKNTVSGTWFNTNKLFDIDFSDNTALNNVWYQIDDNNTDQTKWHNLTSDGTTVLPGSQNNTGTSLTTDWKISNTDWNNLTSDSQNEGRHYLYFKVTDDAGNEYITPDNTAAFEFRKDVINPIVNFVSPQDGQLFTVDNVDVSWSANDVFGGLLLSGVDKIYYAIDQNSSFTAVDPSVLSHSFTGLSNGKHFIYLKAKDIAGNESSLQTLNFSVHVPAVLEFTSGDNQHGLVGTPLSQPFTATVKDAGGYPVQGITVNFAIQSVPSGALGQSLTRTNGVTDAAGKIKSLLTLGEIPGDYLVTVTAAGISDSYLIFTATATVSDTKILAVNPDGSSDFGSVNLNASTDRTIVLQNNGSAALNISHIAISGSDAAMFSIISPSGTAFDIPAGESVPVSVRFIPTGGGGKSASLDLTSNSDNATSKSITLNGNGVLPNAVITVSTGQLRNGTADGTPVLASGISGRGKAASFDGSWRIVVDNSTPADFALKGNWTMAYSVFPQNDVRWGNGFIQRIGDEGECNKRGIYMFLDTPDGLKNLTAFDKTYFGGNENATKLSLDALQLGQWNRIIIVHRSDQTADIYINGVKTYSNISLSIDDAGTKKISIGGNYLNDGCYAADFANSVMLDDFVLLKDALTETQVTPDNLTSPVGFNDPQLPSYFKYDFEETLIADKSSQTVMTLGNLPVGSNSVPQSFQVSGTNLTDDVTLSAPDGFQLSAASDGSYGGSLLLSPSGGNVSSTVYVRFSPALVQTYSGNISIASSGVTTVNVSLTGAGVPVLPTLTTKGISSITASTVMGGGEISSDGGEALSAKGVCWGADSNPTVSLSTKTSDGTGIGTFVSLISGLNPSTTYHVRAYASNSAGTSYGDDVTFTTAAHDNMPQLYMDNFVNLDSLILYGSPLPVHVPSFAGRTDLFDNSGDEGFNSGAITKNSWDLSKGFVLESEVYLDFSNPEGCWNSAAIGLANPSYQSWGGYDAFVIFSYTAVGAQCLATDATRRHAILHGGYLSTSGWESFGDGSPIIADAYLNNWQRLKIVMGSDRIPQFYIGGTLLYAGQNPVADQVFAEKNRIWLGDRSSGNAGKAYHDWVKLSGFITPKVVTSMLSNITNSTATGGGNINADHDFNLSARGVCWSTSENPTADLSSKTTDGTGNGVFISAISGLTPGTTYHIRAYATNADGTYYGDDISFITAIDNPDNTLQDDNVLNTIMSGLKIVEKIKPGNMTLSVDQNKMLTDNYNSCVKIGDYIVYTKTAQSLDPVDRSFESGTAFTGDMLPENLLIKFAWKSDGTVYIGAMGTDDEVLAAIVDGTGGSIGCYSGQRTFFEGYAISTELKNMQTASLVAGIPSPDSLNTVDFFRKMSSKIFNRFSKPIFRIFSAVAFQGSPYPVLNPEFALWCPFPGLTTGTATRSFNLSYTNNLNSYVTAVANTDNGNSGYIKLDGTIASQMSKWAENYYRHTAVYPASVEIGASTIWAHSAPRFSMAIVCDNVLYSNANQNPTGGLSNNRPPLFSGIPVYQSDFTPTLDVDKGSLSLQKSVGGEATFNISSNTNWVISSASDWVGISLSKGSGDKAIVITALSANPSLYDRNSTITVSASGIGSKTINVVQEGNGSSTSVQDDNVLNTIMSGLKIVERIFPGTMTLSVDQNKMLTYNYNSCVKIGDYIVYTKTAQSLDPADRSLESGTAITGDMLPENLQIKFAWKSDGLVYMGAVGSDDEVLAAIVDGTENTVGCYSGQRTFFEGFALSTELKNMQTASLVAGIPSPDSLNTVDFFRKMSSKIFNRFSKPIFRIFSAVAFQGSPYAVLNPEFALWCPFPGLTTGTATRSFNLSYTNNLNSYVTAVANNDNANSSYIKLDGDIVAQMHKWIENFYRRTAVYPLSVEIGASTIWAHSAPRFSIATVCDNVLYSDVNQNPAGGLSNNRPPMISGIPVYQSDFTPTLSVNKGNISLGFSIGSTETFNISSNTNWEVSVDGDWISISQSKGTGDKAITIVASAANPASSDRNITITVNAPGTDPKTITVTQKGAVPAITDVEGNVYPILKIGDQWWMGKDLKTGHYNNGEQIANITVNSDWSTQVAGAYCWYNNDETANKNTFGALYNYYSVADNRNLCPTNWHVPSIDEWTTLTNSLGGASVAGDALKEAGTNHWWDGNAGTNSSGFTAVPGGSRYYDDGVFYWQGGHSRWWSSTLVDTNNAWINQIQHNEGKIDQTSVPDQLGVSVRCVKDVSPLDNGLIAYYPFNGNAIDESGNNHNGTVNNAQLTTDRFGNSNKAYRFNGTTDYINLAGTFGGNTELTISAWVYVEQPTSDFYAIVSSNAWGSFCHFQLTGSAGGGIGIYTSPAYFDAPGLNVTPTGRWRHTVLTVKNGETRVYEDNVIQSQSGQTVANFTSTSNLMIGSGFQNGRFFNGKIDDVRIFNRAISESEVDALFKEGGYSGYGSYLVFNSYQEGHSDVYSCNPDGSNRKQLTSNSVEDYNPKISPDGNKIAFTSDESGQYEVYTMNRDGSGRAKVTSTGTYGGANGAGYVRWFDNDYLLYTLNTSIRKVKRDGSENTEIITSANGNPIHNFDYCKLTGKIVYQAQGGWAYINNFYLVNLDGTGAQLVVGDRQGLEHYPVFSPDGTKIVYMFDVSGHEEGTGRTLNDHLFMHEIAGGAETDLSAEKPDGYNDVELAFASDGSGMIYSSIVNDSSQPSSLFTYSTSGSHRSLLISDAFSPDVWPKVDNFTPTQNVSKTNLILPYTAGTSTTFNINSNTGWQIATDASWLTVSATCGFGDKVITVSSKSTNPGLNDHVGTITVSASGTTSNLVTVTQKGSGLTVIDNEGNIYPIVKIGDQWWMAENLKTTHYNNGDQIPNVTDNAEWAAQTGGAYCWYGNDAAANKETYGALYNWYTVNDGRQIAPKGWHVATDDEWTTLTNYLVSTGVVPCGALKETGFTHWSNPNEGATNSSGFGALPGGYRFDYGGFLDVNIYGHWWSNTASDTDKAWYYYIFYTGVGVARNDLNKKLGFSVRCVKDVSTLDSGLIASYPFNGNAQDQSGNELDLIPNTNPIAAVDRFNNLTGAYSFNGTSDYFIHPTDPLLLPANELSLCAWFYSTGIDGVQDVLISTLGNSAQNGYQLNLDQSTNTIGVLLRNPDGNYVTVTTPLDISYLNAWTSVVFTYSNIDGCKLYVNNVLKTQVNTPFQIEYGADQNFRIGANFPDEGADRMFKGKIDDVRVYSRALTESEVDVLYHEGGWPLSGNDKYLVFNSYQTGNSYVYSCKPDGSNRTQLTSNSCQDYNPKISPDGTKIAFTSDESGQYDVYLMNRDGSGRVKVTSTGTYGGANGAGYVRWLDNDRLLYTLGTTIRKVNTDGSANSVIVTSANGNPIHDFDYSSVTGKIVYQAQGGWAYVNDFYLVNLDGSGAELLIGNRAGLEHYPVFNTDGTKIFYTYDLSGHEEVTGRSLDDHLFMHQLTDHSETDLSSEKPDGYVDLESAFIADGSRIVFSSKLNDESQPSSLYTESSTGVGRSLLISDAFSPDIWPRFGNITPLLSVDKTDISLPSSAGTEATFNVSSNTSWDISSSAPWLNISPAIGFGNKEITVSSKVTNSGTNDQTATITISSSGTASKIVTVTQTGTGLTITDFDNNNYSTVQIGNQLWMGENLKTKHYNTGAEIPNVTDNSEWAALTSGAYCWYGNDEASNKNPYGGMYNWHAVNTGNLCPVNWHVPTDAEWTTLTDYLGAVSAAGDALKEAGTTHWWGGNAGTNSSGFAAVGAGNRYYENGDFYWQGGACRYWSSNAEDSANAWALELNYSNSSPIRLPLLLNQGVSVRCLQNSGTPDNTITLSSGQGTNTQSVCINTAITPITYATTGATGADFTDLPTGVTGLWESNVVTISGTPNASDGSPFNYTVTLTGGSGSVSAHGTITVNPIPTISVTTPATCSQDLLTWSVEVTVSSGTVSTTAGTVTNTSGNNWSVSAVALGINITLTVTDVNSCQNVLDITAPDCNCPVINAPVSGGDKQYCSGESVPQISASVGSGETVDWYTAQSGGSLLLSGSLTYTPDAAGTFYAASRNTTSGCLSTTRTAVIVTMNSLPTITITTLSSCSPDLLTWSVGVTVSSGTVTSTAGTVTNTSGNIWSITGIPAATNITLSVTNSNNCVNTLSATAPDCSCPVISAPVSGGNKQYCTGESVPQINASVGNGLSVDWYAVQSGGSALLAGSLTYTPVTAGTYYAEARNTITGCTSTTRTPVIVTMNSLPTQFAVTGGGTYCSGQPGVAVGLGGSQAGVNYQLQLAGANTGSPVSGTGSAISFGIQSSVGTYTVTGTNPTTTCSSNMTGNAVVSVIPDCSTHFVTVWTGNGQDHMNINIVQAQTGAVDLEAGDEIGAFDGNLCVGMIKLTQTIHQAQPATFGIVKASRADQGVPNGFTAGDAIVFKIWDTSTQQEKTANHVDFLNPANGQVISPVPYAAGGSTFVKLSWLNTPPVANAGPDQIVSEGDLVSLDGSGSSDGDNDPLTYQWVQTEGSTVTLGYSNTSAPTFTAPSVTQNTDFGFALTVNDGTENSVADNVTVTVRPIPKHFLPVWSGNGQDHMNFNVYSVKLDGTDLELGDEIGLYDGFKCVGAGILQGTLSNSNLLAMVASADDGSGNGYTPGHSITYRVYDKSADKEVQGVTATYSTSNPSWSSDGKYAVSATTFVGLDARTTEIQQVLLNAGWNIFSLRVMPGNVNMSSICQPLIDATKLNKVMDESGKAFEDWGVFGGWQNNIGNLQNTEGYKINVSSTVTLSVEGLPVQLPLDIPMSTGWNIISWPSANEQDGKTVMQTLIDAGKVTKVMDQAGRAIEDWGVFGGWQNNIGNLKPGEGYKVNVSGNCTLTVNQFGTKSTEIIPDLLASSYYKPVYSGYGDDHMNINLVDIVQSGLQVGDQIGIFDGKYCVGAVTIGADQLKAGTVSIPASSNDGLSKVVNGFTAGHQVELELFRESQTFKLEQLILKGNNTFEKNGSLFVNVTSKELNVKKSSADSDQFKCYPNPFNDEVTIYILNPQDTEITVGIYNLLGQQIKTLFKGQNKGELILKWDGTNDSGQLVSKGVYLCRMNGRFIKLVYNGDN